MGRSIRILFFSMDHISAGAGALAFVRATAKVVKGIRRLKALQDAARELADLLAETSQLELVLHAVHNAFDARSPLLYAVKHRRVGYVRVLLKYGADPNVGDPPLWAATAGCADFTIFELLLGHGASLNPALSPASATDWLPWAFSDPDYNHVKFDQLLIVHGIDIDHGAECDNVKDVTVLMRLASQCRIYFTSRRLELFINLGADAEPINEEGRTAIKYATLSASTETLVFSPVVEHALIWISSHAALSL